MDCALTMNALAASAVALVVAASDRALAGIIKSPSLFALTPAILSREHSGQTECRGWQKAEKFAE